MKNFTSKLTRFSLIVIFIVLNVASKAQNNALDFDGENDFVQVAPNPLLETVKAIDVWAKVNVNNNYPQSVITSRGEFSGFSFYAGADGHWQFWGGDGSEWVELTGPAVNYGEWTHLAGTYDGLVLRFYVNGLAVDSISNTMLLPNNGFPLRIGAGVTELAEGDSEVSYFYFGGQIDEARLWDTSLSQTQIVDNMHRKLTGTEPHLVAWYNFNQGIPGGDNAGLTSLGDSTSPSHGLNGTLFNFELNGPTSNWVGSDVVLPVSLVNFSASRKDGVNLLQWSTASEYNSSYYEVQRSQDGSKFTSIGKVSAAGNSSVSKNYQYADYGSSLSPVSYYRLRMVDIDGSSKYSSIVFIKNNAASLTTVYPNPARSQITISTTDDKLVNTQASITDMNGKVIQKMIIRESSTQINISNYLKGVYMLRLADGKTVKFIKE